jgi:hypothetical protein
MRLFRRLIPGVVPVVALLLLVDLIPYSPAEAAGPDPSLCSFTSGRLNLPSGFPLNVCWDGSRVVIKNTTPFVMQISLSGNIGSLSRTSVNGDAAGAVIAATDTNPSVLAPEYQLTVPVGSSGASLTAQGNSENVTYLKLRALEGFVPGNVFADYEAISGFAGELSDDSSQYAQCKAGANFIEAAACSASFAWNVSFAVDRLAVETGIQLFTHSLSLGALLNLINTALWAEDAVTSADEILLESPHSFSISPTSPSPTRGANAGTGSASPTGGAPAPAPAPSSSSASPQFYVYYVYHTCANGACGLNLRSDPGYSNYPVTRVLVDGDPVDIVCQTQGQSVSGIDGSSSDVWDKTVQGDYAADFYIDTPGMTGSFSPPIPQC